MPTYHVEFGALGDGRPVPDFSITTDDINEFHRAVARHAVPYMRPVLEAMGHPEYADCFFHVSDDRTAGQFMWIDILANRGVRFCGARIRSEAA